MSGFPEFGRLIIEFRFGDIYFSESAGKSVGAANESTDFFPNVLIASCIFGESGSS